MRFRPNDEEQVTFLIEAQDHAKVLLPVVALFDELKVELDAVWMLRQKRTGNARASFAERPRHAPDRRQHHVRRARHVLLLRNEERAEFYEAPSRKSRNIRCRVQALKEETENGCIAQGPAAQFGQLRGKILAWIRITGYLPGLHFLRPAFSSGGSLSGALNEGTTPCKSNQPRPKP